jgi:hypothetical protein
MERQTAGAGCGVRRLKHSFVSVIRTPRVSRTGSASERSPSDWPSSGSILKTSARDRKRVVRLLIEDVTLQTAEQIVAHIRFKGGATQTLSVPFPPPFAQSRLTAPKILEVMQQLLHDATDAQTAEQLNALGYRTFTGLPFHATHVAQLRRHHRLKDRYTSLREQGWLTAAEIAEQCGISVPSVWRWYHQGRLVGTVYNDRGTCLFALSASMTAAE